MTSPSENDPQQGIVEKVLEEASIPNGPLGSIGVVEFALQVLQNNKP